MKKVITLIFFLSSLVGYSQNIPPDRIQVMHGDTSFIVKLTYTTVPDSVITNATDSTPRIVKYFYRITSTQRDSFQLNKLSTSQIPNTAGYITPVALVPYTPSTKLIDTAAALRAWMAQIYLAAAAINNYSTTAQANALYAAAIHTHPYNTITGLPTLFDGAYASLTGKPTIPTNTNQLTNGAGFLVIGDISTKANITSQTFVNPNIGVATGTSAAVTGALSSSGTAGIGYATGAGGTVTQATSKTTGVTLNKTSGQITMNGAALAAAAEVAFTLTNSTIAATDVVYVCIQSVGTSGSYFVSTGAVAAGSCSITVGNVSAGSLSQAVVLNFVVIKGVTN